MKHIITNDELYHHGILGQRWGIRRYQNPDGTLTSQGKIHYGSNSSSKTKTDDKESIESHDKGGRSHKANIAIDAAVFVGGLGTTAASVLLAPATGGTSLMAAGLGFAASYYGASGITGELISMNKEKLSESERSNSKIDKKTGLLLKNDEAKDMSPKEDLKRCNPSYLDGNANSSKNCMLCTTAYDMRRRGYEVTANKASYGYEVDDIKKWYPDVKIETVSDKNITKAVKRLESTLLEQGDGARGNLMLAWDHRVTGSYGGHSMIYEVENGKVILRDGQTSTDHGTLTKGALSTAAATVVGVGYVAVTENLSAGRAVNNALGLADHLAMATPSIQYARLDNVDFDPKTIKEAVR